MVECPTPINLNFMGMALLGVGAGSKPLPILNFYRKANGLAGEFNRARKYALKGKKEKAYKTIETLEKDINIYLQKEQSAYSIIFAQMQGKVDELKNYLDTLS